MGSNGWDIKLSKNDLGETTKTNEMKGEGKRKKTFVNHGRKPLNIYLLRSLPGWQRG